MNKDFRIAVSFPYHPKTKKLMKRLGDRAIYSLIRLWSFVAMNKPDGVLSDMDIEDIEIASDWNGNHLEFVSVLLDLNFMDKNEDIYSIHDWEEHNGYAFYSPQRSEKARNAAKARWEKCSENKELMLNDANSMLSDATSNAPSPVPSPIPSPKKEPPPFEKIISYLNEKANKNFKHTTNETKKIIIARWNQGYSFDDFKKVIDIKCQKWLIDPKFIDYIRPQTLFGTKFESYLNEQPKQPKKIYEKD